jgi:hypothetical protein
MNYIHLVNYFWQCDLEHHLTANDTRLYFYLLHTCNSLGWKMPFGHSDRHLSMNLGVSVNTVRECKNRLKQRKLIDFTIPQTKSKAYEGQTKFSLIAPSVSKNDTVNAPTDSEFDTDTDTDGYTVPDTVPDTNNKLNKTKHKYRPNVKLSLPEHMRLVEEFGEDLIRAAYDYLSDYKKEKGYATKDDNLTIRRWVIDAVSKKNNFQRTPVVNLNADKKYPVYNPYDRSNYYNDAEYERAMEKLKAGEAV